MLRKSKAFASTQGGESRFSPLRIPHRDKLTGTTKYYIIFNLMTNALIEIIKEKIITGRGRISFADFMALALYHPQHGYYFSENFALGKQGDFTTAPEISPLFAQCFARQCEQIFSALGVTTILEMGAGTGKFAGDLLLALENTDHPVSHYFIYEISTTLRKKQQEFLSKYCPLLLNRVTWLDQLPTNFKGVVIANEVLDALPVHLFLNTEDGVKERCVAVKNNELAWEICDPISPRLAEKATHIIETYHLPTPYASEINLNAEEFIKNMTHSLAEGVILFADYGYGQAEYYHHERTQGSLTCFYQHQRSENPLEQVGEQDITAHVDFTQVIDLAYDQGCSLLGYTTQTSFLLACGLLELAANIETNLTPSAAFQLHQAIKVLTLPTEMGERVKIMALGKGIDIRLRGFTLQDRRRDL